MNKLSAYDLAVELCNYSLDGIHKEAADMLRQQADRIKELEKQLTDEDIEVVAQALFEGITKEMKHE